MSPFDELKMGHSEPCGKGRIRTPAMRCGKVALTGVKVNEGLIGFCDVGIRGGNWGYESDMN